MSYAVKADQSAVHITDIKFMLVRGGLDWPMVKVETDAGVSGIGECVVSYGLKDFILNHIKPAFVGENPFNVEQLYSKIMLGIPLQGETAGTKIAATAGVEMALWDLAGKLLGVPATTLLGGRYRDTVPAYWTLNHEGSLLDKSACKEYADLVKKHPYGIRAVKRGWVRRSEIENPLSRRFTRRDIARAADGFINLREAFGDDYEIIVHSHWEFDWPDALALSRAIAPINPWWNEDPMPVDFSESWVRLTAESPVPILTGENLYTRHGFKPFVIHGGCHMIQPDIQKNGLLESKKIADLADMFYMPVCSHCMGSPLGLIGSANAAATMRDFLAHELNIANLAPATEEWEKFVEYDRPIIEDGRIQLSEKPGFGVELNEDHIRANLVDGEEWWG